MQSFLVDISVPEHVVGVVKEGSMYRASKSAHVLFSVAIFAPRRYVQRCVHLAGRNALLHASMVPVDILATSSALNAKNPVNGSASITVAPRLAEKNATGRYVTALVPRSLSAGILV